MINENDILFKIPIDKIVEALKPAIIEVISNHFNQLILKPPNSDDGGLITRREAAQILRVSLPVIDRAWKQSNPVLKAYRLGGNKIRFKKAEVMEALQEVSSLKYSRNKNR